jgi:hypothetical protein
VSETIESIVRAVSRNRGQRPRRRSLDPGGVEAGHGSGGTESLGEERDERGRGGILDVVETPASETPPSVGHRRQYMPPSDLRISSDDVAG